MNVNNEQKDIELGIRVQSPSKITRLKEKNELQSLNDRFFVYINAVRRLEPDNSQLKKN